MATWTDQQFTEAVRQNFSVASILRCLGLKPSGANYKTVHQTVKRLGLDTGHWTGQAHRKGLPSQNHKAWPLEQIFMVGSSYRGSLRKKVIQARLFPEQCVLCAQGLFWKGAPLTLVLDHINGINNDNRLENLRWLCPNCNSQQETFAGGNKPKGRRRYNCECGAPISRGAKRCCPCATKARVVKR